jgi:hypothetical protein
MGIDEDLSTRAARRRAWPIRTFRLGQEPSENLSRSTTPEQRLEMMWPLALDAWALAGRPFPEYSRSETPVRRLERSTLGKS